MLFSWTYLTVWVICELQIWRQSDSEESEYGVIFFDYGSDEFQQEDVVTNGEAESEMFLSDYGVSEEEEVVIDIVEVMGGVEGLTGMSSDFIFNVFTNLNVCMKLFWFCYGKMGISVCCFLYYCCWICNWDMSEVTLA